MDQHLVHFQYLAVKMGILQLQQNELDMVLILQLHVLNEQLAFSLMLDYYFYQISLKNVLIEKHLEAF